MSKYQKGEVTQRGKGKFVFIEGSNNIIFRISVIFRMSFAHHLQCEAPTPPPPISFSCIYEGKHCFLLINKVLWIKSQPGVAYKSVAYKKSCKSVLQSFKNEKMTLSHEFIFVFILYLIGAILPKNIAKSTSSKKTKREGWLAVQRRNCLQKCFKLSGHYNHVLCII